MRSELQEFLDRQWLFGIQIKYWSSSPQFALKELHKLKIYSVHMCLMSTFGCALLRQISSFSLACLKELYLFLSVS